MHQPNIILIVLDSLRADNILIKRNGIFLTPTLRKLKKNSYFFKNCISNNTWTLPSHNSIFSGLYSTEIKRTGKALFYINNKIPLLTEILRDNGYYTLCFTENPWLNESMGNFRGFQSYITNFCLKNDILTYLDKIFKYLKLKIKKFTNSIKFLSFLKLTEKVINKALKTLLKYLYWEEFVFNIRNTINELDKLNVELKKNLENKPNYLFFNIMAPHYPYIPPKKVLEKFGINKNHIDKIRSFLLKPIKYFRNVNIRSLNLSKQQIGILNKLYDSSVYYCDLIINKLIRNLKNLGILKNSYVIITSDHGEHLCSTKDHSLYGHGIPHSVYEELIKVPLMIYHPKFNEKIIKDQVELKDLFHTILDFSRVRNDCNFFDIRNSLLYQVKNNETSKIIFGEHLKRKNEMMEIIRKSKDYLNPELVRKILYDVYFLRTQNYKYINYENKIEELYDLNCDLKEKSNIIEINEEISHKMKHKFNKCFTEIKNINYINKNLMKKEKESIKRAIENLKL